MPSTGTFDGRLFCRGEQGYEQARLTTVWRDNVPDRYPAAILRVRNEADVAEGVRLAAERGWQVGVKSGGHSWTSPHLRDGILLIDMEDWRSIAIDADSRTAWVAPAVRGRELNDALRDHGLMAPTGHHDSVACGGFLMCGGFGWNFRQWGNGCRNVLAIELVNAQGELIRASETENADYFWAARGGGAGFFGVITRFQVQAYPRPSHLRANVLVLPSAESEAALHWLYEILPALPVYCELVATWSSFDPATGNWAPAKMTVSGLTFANSDAEAEAVAALFDTCPVGGKALVRLRSQPTTLEERYAAATAADPPGHRFAADNIYTDKGAEAVAPLVSDLVASLPTPRSHVFWCYNGPRPDFSGMALSAWGETYIAAYPIWSDPAEDDSMQRWAVEAMRAFAPVANGEAQMNDENMEGHAQHYLSPEAAARLEALRLRHDPDARFISFLGPVAS